MGSIHLGKDDDADLPPAIASAFQASALLVQETSMGKDAKEAAAGLFLAASAAKVPLVKAVGSKLYERTQAVLSQLGLPGAVFENRRPWFVALTVMVSRLATLGFQPEQGMDARLRVQGEARNMPMEALEPIEAQVKVFESLDPKAETDMLAQALWDDDKMKQVMMEMTDAWRAGDQAKLYQAFVEPVRTMHPAFFQSLFADRNKRMAAGIQKIMSNTDGAVFVVVGAGHLVGPDSVIDLLSKAGFSFSQL